MTFVVPPLVRRARRGALPALAGAAAIAALAAPPALAAVPGAIERTFTTVGCGGANEFVVPVGITTVRLKAIGGSGGVGAVGSNTGGRGAIVEGELTVTPGQTLSACVGVNGGAGGAGTLGWYGGGRGGGASSVYPAGASDWIVAGGGGGGGGDGGNGGLGGDAGLHGRGAGHGGDAVSAGGRGGRGATPQMYGAGGVHPTSPGRECSDGTAGAGGAGGSGHPSASGSGGGGGGGGAMGGGGGAGGHRVGVDGTYAGGGGGGSSRCDEPAVSGCASRLATYATAPSVTITTKPSAPLTVTVSPDPVERGNHAQYTATFATAPAAGSTVDFAVEGTPVAGCSAVPVVATRASCWGSVPAVVGRHTATASFAGDADWDPAEATGSFDVALSSIAFSAPSPAFGDVLVGVTAPSKPVTVTNDSAFGVFIGYTTFTLRGKTARSYAPTVSPRGGVRLVGADAASFRLTSDTCTSAYLEPGRSCVVEVAFTPTRNGAHEAAIQFDSTAAGSPHLVALSGSGVTARAPAPDPGPSPQQPQPEQPKPTAPQPAALAPSARGRATVSESGALTLPLVCPRGSVCSVSGTLTVSAGALASGARSAAAKQQVLATFNGVAIRSGAVKALRLRIPQRFVEAAQKAGKRTVRATLTITTRRAGHRTVVTRRQVTLALPRAAPAPRPAEPGRRPSFTG